MAVKTIELTRKIRDSIYNKIKNLSKEDQINFYRVQAANLNNKLKQAKKSQV